MANVMFKRGLHKDLPWSSAVNGAFYLTTDSDRLYIGKEDGSLADLNKYVKIIESLADGSKLPVGQEGDFLYIKDSNILAVYSGDAWKQINVNTNDTVNDIEFTAGEKVVVGEGESAKDAIKYTLKLTQKDVNGKVITETNAQGEEVPVTLDADLVITEDMVTSLVVNVEVDVAATVEDNVATVITTGAGSHGDGFKVKGADGITITTEENFDGFVIDGTTYELELEETKIQLRNSNNTGDDENDIDGVVEFIDDDKWIEVTNDNGKIKVAHIGKSLTENVKEITPTSGTAKELVDDEKIEVITGLTIEKGHITGYEVSEYTAQDTTYTVETEIDTDKTVKVSLRNSDTNQVDSFDNVDISSDLIVNGVTKKIQPTGSIELDPYYTKEEVDAQHRAINAMVYKGVVDSTHALPSTAEIGWTYKVGEEGTYAGIECGVGDILIANGEEDDDGVLTSITWDHIDTSDFEDTTYDLQAKDNKIILHNNVTLGNDEILVEDDDIVILKAQQVTRKIDGEDVAFDVLSGEHKAIDIEIAEASTENKPTELKHEDTFTVITGFDDDKHGHITEFTTTTFKLPASGDTIEADAANVKLTFKDVAGDDQGSIDIDAKSGDPITVEGASTDGKNLVATIGHSQVTKNNTTGTATPKHGETFDVIEAVTYDNYGHVSGVKTTTVTLPEETEYEIEGPTAISKGVQYALKNDEGATKGDPIELVSDSLAIGVSESKTQTVIDIVWGSF